MPALPITRILALAFAVQVLWLVGRHHTSTREVDIRIGSQLPFEISLMDGEWAGLSIPSAGCAEAFLCTTTCAACRALALDLAGGKGVDALWLLPGSWEEISRWASETGVELAKVGRLEPRKSAWGGWVSGKIWFTPLRLVLSEALTVKDMWPAIDLLTQSEVEAKCAASGGP